MPQASRRQALWLTLVVAGLVGCAHEVRLVSLSDGTLIKGTTKLWDQSVILTLPSGEILEGEFFSLSNKKLGPDSQFYGANLGAMLGGRVSGRFHGYAYLTGTQGAVVEIIFASDWTGRGFGFARTSLGEEYRVSF